MKIAARTRSFIRSVFQRSRVEEDLEEELRLHLEHRTEHLIHEGFSLEAARRQAQAEFGPLAAHKDQVRESLGLQSLDEIRMDCRHAFRQIRRAPAGFAVAVTSLALGIGAATVVFGVVDAVLLRPLPYRDASRLVAVVRQLPGRSLPNAMFQDPDLDALKVATTDVFEDLAGLYGITVRVTATAKDGTSEELRVQGVTWNFLPMLGAQVARGRMFRAEDAGTSAEAAASLPEPILLSYQYWQRRYGGDENVVGNVLPDSKQLVLGVLAPEFELLLPGSLGLDLSPDFWTAFKADFMAGSRPDQITPFFRVVGRLKQGVSVNSAQAAADAFSARTRATNSVKDRLGEKYSLVTLHEFLVAGSRSTIWLLMGAVAFLFLIACANVANLLLVRTSTRKRELTVRAALGGSTPRLVRQLLVEALVLGMLGTAAGLGVAWVGLGVLPSIAPPSVPRISQAGIDAWVFAFASAAGVVAAALFGLVPAWSCSHPNLALVLKASVRTLVLGRSSTLRQAVVVAEVALAFVLLIGSGLMLRTFVNVETKDLGFDSQDLLTLRVNSVREGAPEPERAALLQQVHDRLRAIPGVRDATATRALPLSRGFSPTNWSREDSPADAPQEQAVFQVVLPGYFGVMRTPLVAGRPFTREDNSAAARVVVVDEHLAVKAFPEGSAVGKRIRLTLAQPELYTIIGIAAHQQATSVTETGLPQAYLPSAAQRSHVDTYWILRVNGEPTRFADAVKNEIHQIDPRFVITEIDSLDAIVRRAQGPVRFQLTLMGAFATVAALLALIGLFSVLASVVRQRTSEIGVRMALGAAPSTVFASVIGRGLKMSAAGIVIGLAASWGLTRYIQDLLAGVPPSDPWTFGGVAIVFLCVAVVASCVPARRAARLAPVDALREG